MKKENIISNCTERVGTKDERVKAGEDSRRQEEKTFWLGQQHGGGAEEWLCWRYGKHFAHR